MKELMAGGTNDNINKKPSIYDHFIWQDGINKYISEIVKQLDDKLLSVLEKNGYIFKDKIELEKFIQKKCEIISFKDSPRKILRVDGKQICEWYHTYELSNYGNNFTITFGKPIH